uniref:Amine oxidase n=1 Tax=Heterorhabditis bacteriophora TaxID=37862 RepID=A0A1I7X878_HETBA
MEDFESTYVAFLSFSVIEGEIIGHVLHNNLEERNYDEDATIQNMLQLRLITPKNPALEGRGFFPRSKYIVTRRSPEHYLTSSNVVPHYNLTLGNLTGASAIPWLDVAVWYYNDLFIYIYDYCCDHPD